MGYCTRRTNFTEVHFLPRTRTAPVSTVNGVTWGYFYGDDGWLKGRHLEGVRRTPTGDEVRSACQAVTRVHHRTSRNSSNSRWRT
jgi:hypothetical protein